MKNELFITAGEVVQEFGVSKICLQIGKTENRGTGIKKFITISGYIHRKYYEENFYFIT